MTNDNSYYSYPVSLRKQVCKLLDENQLLTAKMLCKLLELPYKRYKQTITNYRSFWLYNHESERGSKCSNFHCYKAKTKLDVGLNSDLRVKLCFGVVGGFVGFGWRLSLARNKFLVWTGKLGRVTWFVSGTVLLHVKKPGNLGKAKQLFCDAFVNSGLLTDFKLLNPVLERLGPKSCHFPYDTPMRLPYVQINDFVESHGITIKLGDRSHPNAVEVIAEYTSKQEEIESKVSFVFDVFQQVNGKAGLDKSEKMGVRSLDRLGDYSR
jgi:hypothetical protein